MRRFRDAVGHPAIWRFGRSQQVRNLYKYHVQEAALREGFYLAVETYGDASARQEPRDTTWVGGCAGMYNAGVSPPIAEDSERLVLRWTRGRTSPLTVAVCLRPTAPSYLVYSNINTTEKMNPSSFGCESNTLETCRITTRTLARGHHPPTGQCIKRLYILKE